MSEHTPVRRINYEALYLILRHSRKVSGTWDEVDMSPNEWMPHEDDATLMVAAPDLLAACEALLRDVEEEGLEDTGSAALARAAIAKARGE